MRALTSLLTVAALAYTGFALYLYALQARYIYFPDTPGRALAATPADAGLTYEEVTLHTDDGEALHAWYVPATQPRATLLFVHGNAGNISHRIDQTKLFIDLGLNVLQFDYRGYGRSSGSPSEDGTYRDAQAAWHYLVDQRRLAPHDIVIYGESLGGAIATWLAARTTPRALIVQAAFTSAADVAQQIYPWLPVKLLLRYRYDTLNEIAAVRSPVLVIHSRDDEIIPFAHGQRLFAAAHPPKQFLEIHGGHNDVFGTDPALHRAGILRFLEQTLAPPSAEIEAIPHTQTKPG